MKDEMISVSFGSGGKETRDFINKLFLKAFNNPYLAELEDSAIVPIEKEKIAYSIDGHTISPIFFKGYVFLQFIPPSQGPRFRHIHPAGNEPPQLEIISS